MLDFKNITIDDKKILNKYLKPYKFNTCEYSFTNLFIWRKGCDIQYTIYDDALIIKKKDFDGTYHFMQPVGFSINNLDKIMDALIKYKDNHNMDFLFKDTESDFINKINELYPKKFSIREDRDNFDYIYKSEKLINLSGKKLHSKKNHFNHFIKNYNYSVKELSSDNAAECIQTAKYWYENNNSSIYLLYELNAIEEILHNIGKLDFVGMAVYVDDKLSAFTIGEKVNENMVIVHIEKANSNINGLYTFINKTFVENYFKDVPYINREQDLGIEGLRKSKLSYQPYEFSKKYIVL